MYFLYPEMEFLFESLWRRWRSCRAENKRVILPCNSPVYWH